MVWVRCRFSQKTNKQTCFVCCEKQKSKQTKFFERIYSVPICFPFYLTFSSTASKSCKKQLEVHFRLQNWYHIVVIVVYNNEKKENLIQSWVTWCKQTAEHHFFWFLYNHFKIGLCPKLCYQILWRIQPRYNTVDSQLCTKMYKKSKYWQNMLNML